jgi:hypothetical protein
MRPFHLSAYTTFTARTRHTAALPYATRATSFLVDYACSPHRSKKKHLNVYSCIGWQNYARDSPLKRMSLYVKQSKSTEENYCFAALRPT